MVDDHGMEGHASLRFIRGPYQLLAMAVALICMRQTGTWTSPVAKCCILSKRGYDIHEGLRSLPSRINDSTPHTSHTRHYPHGIQYTVLF